MQDKVEILDWLPSMGMRTVAPLPAEDHDLQVLEDDVQIQKFFVVLLLFTAQSIHDNKHVMINLYIFCLKKTNHSFEHHN